MSNSHYLAVDLGAESGRVMLGTLTADKLHLEEIHRFPNLPVRMGDSLRWDIMGMFREMKAGIATVAKRGVDVAGISVDSWGVDYVWIGAGQPMLAPSFVYRDARNDHARAEALKFVPPEAIFAETGLQLMPFNTVFQLFADHRDFPALVGIAEAFLPIADFYLFLFSGMVRTEESLASTTQVYDPRSRNWSEKLIRDFGFETSIFPKIVPSATILGPLQDVVGEECGLGAVPVIATCSHDTGAAVAAVPAAEGDDWAFLSSGTWSLMGVELPEPLMNQDVLKANFSNEMGFGGTPRFLKNIVGLWILQECRRTWEKEGRAFTYAEITNLAAEAEPLRSLIHPNDARFIKPGGMPDKVRSFCRETGQPEPTTPGQIARCILESLALTYRENLDLIESLTGRTIRKLHIVGGGSQSMLLNQFAANATERTVLAGPTEATAIGNILIQAIATDRLASLAELRKTVRASFTISEFAPADLDHWREAAERFAALPVNA
jgi:rhamnulokinase